MGRDWRMMRFMEEEKRRQYKDVRVTRSQLGRLLGIARAHWWKLGSMLVTTAVLSLLGLMYPALVGRAIDGVLVGRNMAVLPGLVTLLVALVVTQTLLGLWSNYWSGAVGERIVIDLRVQLYEHMQRLSMNFYQDNHTGDVISRLTNDVTLVRQAIVGDLTSLISSIFTVVGGVVLIIVGPNLLFGYAQQFGVAVPVNQHSSLFNPATMWVVLLLPLAMLPHLLSGGILRGILRKELELSSEMTKVVEETVGSAKIVKAFAREEYEIKRYRELAGRQYKMAQRKMLVSGGVGALAGLLSFGGIVLVIWIIGNAVINGSLTAGDLTMTVMYIFTFSQPLTTMSRLYSQLQMALGAAERIFYVLDQRIEVEDIEEAPALPAIKGRLCFEHVDFCYDEQVQVLEDISFEVEAGQVLALVGASGAGKTTIANLIPRFFDVKRGRITLDGHDISQVKLQSLREQIGMVLQEPVLFSTTIRENIAYGRPDASLEEIQEVARAANAEEFIERLPEGYEALVGERGVKLSVGQRQRIAIARALLRNPRILILDEATSSLDNESEYLVQQALERLMQGRTTVVIAHRLTTIENADKIVVLERGKIVEQGNHSELMRMEGVYRRLYTRAFDEEVEVLA